MERHGRCLRGNLPLSALLLVAATLLIGCGDGDEPGSGANPGDGSTVSTSTLGKQAFVMRASRECRRARDRLLGEIRAYVVRQDKEPPFEEVVSEVIVPKVEEETAIIRNLGAPEGDRDQIEEILAAQEGAIREVEEAESVSFYKEFERYFVVATERLRKYGFTGCMSSP